VGLHTWKVAVKIMMEEGKVGEENNIQACLHSLYFSHSVVTGSSIFCESADDTSILCD